MAFYRWRDHRKLCSSWISVQHPIYTGSHTPQCQLDMAKKIVADGSSNGYHCKLYFPCTQIFICFSWTSVFSLYTKTYLFNINLRLYLKLGTSIPNNKFTAKIGKCVIKKQPEFWYTDIHTLITMMGREKP